VTFDVVGEQYKVRDLEHVFYVNNLVLMFALKGWQWRLSGLIKTGERQK
jgi:hypothetical protein